MSISTTLQEGEFKKRVMMDEDPVPYNAEDERSGAMDQFEMDLAKWKREKHAKIINRIKREERRSKYLISSYRKEIEEIYKLDYIPNEGGNTFMLDDEN